MAEIWSLAPPPFPHPPAPPGPSGAGSLAPMRVLLGRSAGRGLRVGARVAEGARSRAQRPAPGGARRARHAGDVRAGRRRDRQPGRRDVRGVRLVRDAAAGRLRRVRCARGCRRRRRSRSRAACSCALGTLASRSPVARGGRDDARGLRRACSPAWSAPCWRERRRRCCWPSSCRSRCRGPSPRSPIAWPAGAWRRGRRCSPSRCCGRRRRAIRCAARRSRAPARWPHRLRAQVAYVLGGERDALAAERDAAIAQADGAVEALHAAFFATPYRPTGLSTAARTVVRLVDELKWLNAIVAAGSAAPARDGTSIRTSARSRPPRPRCSNAAPICSTRRSGPPTLCTRRWPSCARG